MNHVEHEIQSAFVKAARAIPGCEMLHAIPNSKSVRIVPGENSDLTRIKTQMWMNREGRLPGVLDLFLPKSAETPNRPWGMAGPVLTTITHGLYLETKKPGEKLRKEQAEFILYAHGAGYGVAVYRSVQEGIDILLRYLRGEHVNEAALEEARKVLK